LASTGWPGGHRHRPGQRYGLEEAHELIERLAHDLDGALEDAAVLVEALKDAWWVQAAEALQRLARRVSDRSPA